MTKLVSYFTGLIFLLLATSCETDVDLRAPYDDTPIIFGVLDQTVDTQFIKINRSFIGEGNNFKYAAIADCTIFKSVVGTVNEDGGAGRVFPLKELYVKNIDDGIFYEDSQKVYYFITNSELEPLDENASYGLNISIDEGRKDVYSETSLVSDFSIAKSGLRKEMNFVEINASTNVKKYNTLTPIKLNSPGRNLMFTSSLRFHYDEIDVAGNTSNRFVDVPMGTRSADFQGAEVVFPLDGKFLFEKIESDDHIKSTSLDDISKRVIRNIEFYISVANTNLKTYIDLNEPLNGIVQDRPTYTNIEGGRGIFSSRYLKVIDRTANSGVLMGLGKFSIEELFKMNVKFCTDDSKYSQSTASQGPEDFYCP